MNENENPFTTTRHCPTCDKSLGPERYALDFLGSIVTFDTRECMNAWGADNVPGWVGM